MAQDQEDDNSRMTEWAATREGQRSRLQRFPQGSAGAAPAAAAISMGATRWGHRCHVRLSFRVFVSARTVHAHTRQRIAAAVSGGACSASLMGRDCPAGESHTCLACLWGGMLSPHYGFMEDTRALPLHTRIHLFLGSSQAAGRMPPLRRVLCSAQVFSA